MSTECEICGKDFKNTQGLRGHKTFIHQLTTSTEAPSRPEDEFQEINLDEVIETFINCAELEHRLVALICSVLEDQNTRITELETCDITEKRMSRLCPYCDSFSIIANTRAAENRFLNVHLRQQHPDKPLAGNGQVVIHDENGSEVIIADRYSY
ncbi:hypothetical protein ACFLW8_05710 [Chloroflexota bacterium]